MSLPRRVLLVNAHGADPSVGGAEALVARLARLLGARGVEVRFLSAFPIGRPPDGPAVVLHRTHWMDDPVRRVRTHAADALACHTRRLDRIVGLSGADLVHTHNLPGVTTSVWESCRRRGLPVVHSVHDYSLICPRATMLRPDGGLCRPSPLGCGLRTRLMMRWDRGVDAVIAVSDYVLERHRGLFPDATRHVIRHPADPPPAQSPPPPGDRLRTLGYIGTLDRTKGVRELLEAVPPLAAMGVEVRIAGDGRLREEVREAAARMPSLTYAGVVTGEVKARFLASCDAGVVPSVWPEPGGPPFVVIEWLRAGRPVLASDRGGLAEALRDLPGTHAVTPTAAGIADGVRALAAPSAWREAPGRAVAPPSLDDEERWADRYAEVYAEAAARHAGAAA